MIEKSGTITVLSHDVEYHYKFDTDEIPDWEENKEFYLSQMEDNVKERAGRYIKAGYWGFWTGELNATKHEIRGWWKLAGVESP